MVELVVLHWGGDHQVGRELRKALSVWRTAERGIFDKSVLIRVCFPQC